MTFRAHKAAQQHGRTDGVCNDGRYRHAVNRHFENYDEQKLQQHVQYSGHEKRPERHGSLADAAEYRGFKVIQQYHRHTQQVYPQIREGMRKHLAGDVHHAEQCRGGKLARGGDQRPADDGHSHSRVHSPAHGLRVTPPGRRCNDDVHAEGYTYNVINGSPEAFVKSGIGAFLTVRELLSSRIDDGVCFRPLYPALTERHMLVWKRSAALSRAARVFLDAARTSV